MKMIRRGIKITFWLCMTGIIGLIILLGTIYLLGPPPVDIGSTTVFYDQDGNELPSKETQQTFELASVSPYVIDATIVTEDQHFYSHHGFDFRRIVRAMGKNLQALRLKEGASTITQQYARNLFLTHEKTWVRKWKEALYTIRLEMFYSKDEILTGYLHAIYYGHGAYGIEEASHVYFNKQASQLTLAEAAMLAGIPKGPTYYSPFQDETKATERQRQILDNLVRADLISQAEYYEAKQEKLEFTEPNMDKDTFAAFFKDTVLKEAASLLHGEEVSTLTSNYHIYTTLDTSYQTELEEIVANKVDTESDLEIGILSMVPKDGAIIGLVGGKAYEESAFNRAFDAKRMVGSTFKPFVYYAALEQGFTPTTMLLSEPTTFDLGEGQTYTPSNYNGYYAYEPISMSEAIALSDNIYAVKTNLFLGPSNVIKTTRKFGITDSLPDVPSLALGSASISLVDMVQAYSVLANKGRAVDAYSIKKIVDSNGKTIYEREKPTNKQILDPNKTFVLNHLMMGMFDSRLNGYMDVTGSSIIDQLSRTYAGKSGTTDTDSWMIGFSPTVTTGVWTGYDDNRSMQKSADKQLAKQLWVEAIERAHTNKKDVPFQVPSGVEKAIIDAETGFLATKDCPIRRAAYFEAGTTPTEYCSHHLPQNHKQEKQQEKSLFKKLFDLFN